MSDSSDDGDDNRRLILLILGVIVAIPVVLVVGIVVLFLLSAVLGTFVLGVGDAQTATPAASFDFDYAGGSATITHSGGDAIEADRLIVRVDGDARGTWAQLGDTDRVVAGDQLRVSDLASGDVVRLVYQGQDTREVLAQYEVP